MIKINLLPREILEKRWFERWIGVVIAVGLVGLVLVLVFFSVNLWRISGQNELLQQSEQTASQLRSQAEAYEIFEAKEEVLAQRKTTADEALASRVDWGRLANEISLILPSDSWLEYLSGDEDTGMQLSGYAIDAPTDVPDVGHKSVAKTLIRLANLEQLDSVWLQSSSKESFEDSSEMVIRFDIVTGVVRPPAETDSQTPSVPAPPTDPES